MRSQVDLNKPVRSKESKRVNFHKKYHKHLGNHTIEGNIPVINAES